MLRIGGFNTSLYYGEDQEFLVRSIYEKFRYFINPDAFIFYRQHENNLTLKANHTRESVKLMGVILKAIGQEYHLPFFQMVKTWDFERDRNCDWPEIGMIQNYINGLIVKNKKHESSATKLKKIINNKVKKDIRDTLFECALIVTKDLPNSKNLPEDKVIELTLFSGKRIKLLLNHKLIILPKGYTKVIANYNQKTGISFYGFEPHSIYISLENISKYSQS